MSRPDHQRRLIIAAGLVMLFAYEGYALFVKRSGETSYTPTAAELQLSPEIAGETTLRQTFVMHANGLDGIRLYARSPSGAPVGVATLTLSADTYAAPVARRTVAASELVASAPFEWTLPRVDESIGRTYAIEIALPDATPGHGLHFDVGSPQYAQGDLAIGGRSFWGDLRFETHASRVRLIDSLADLRRHAPPVLRSGFVTVLAFLLLNAALVVLIVRLPHASRS